ncbi:MAG: enhanced serine sensitivity protein SseB C-terminal domain-containing protein [Clostridiales bacterium]|nr:enhanced serine sensitivity protein SseB C-terminal domain-containing protein [Clostridiales bacterium]
MSDNEKDNILNLEGDDLDAALMAAIEETEEEEEQARIRKEEENKERAEQARITAIENSEQKAKVDNLRAGINNANQRFYLVNEDGECDEAKGTATLKGSLFGIVKKGDEAFLYRDDGKVLPTKIVEVEALNNGIYEPVDETRDKSVVLTIEVDYKKTGFTKDNGAPKYAVLSSVKPPVADNTGKAPIENPALFALSLKYNALKSDKEYVRNFMQHTVNGRFLVPAHSTDKTGPDGKKSIQIVMLMDKQHNDRKMFPLFTDVRTVALWKDLFKSENKPTLAAMRFPEVIKFIEKEGFDVAINPMGPIPTFLPNKLLMSIASNLGSQIKKEVITDGSKIMIGPVQPNPESEAVRKALIKHCESIEAISKAGLLYIKRSNRVSYFVIVDAPKDEAGKLFPGILAAVKPHLKAIKTVDFSVLSEAPFAKDYFSKKSWDYIRR